jgi:hypothetical protein
MLQWRNNESGVVVINYESEENWNGAICELFNVNLPVFFWRKTQIMDNPNRNIYFFSFDATAPSGPGPPHARGF